MKLPCPWLEALLMNDCPVAADLGVAPILRDGRESNSSGVAMLSNVDQQLGS
jgi:hypothetical protein